MIRAVPTALLLVAFVGCDLPPGDTNTGGGGSDTTKGCVGAAECDDGNPCTADTCENNICSYTAAAAGTACPDASLCNGDETCSAEGVCVAGTPLAIDDSDKCTVDVCDPKTGDVAHPMSPACGAWEPTTSQNAPTARVGHTAVWTGKEMIIWGGEVSTMVDPAGVTSTGAKYDPVAKTWTPTSLTNAPPPRHSHTAVWTGTRMIVWGGYGDTAFESTGGSYDPETDTWTALSASGTPAGRTNHGAAWTGSEMLIWGGIAGGAVQPSGARYSATNDTWSAFPSANEPSPRYGHSLIWDGARAIVWGGNDLFDWHADGAFFDPASGWTGATSMSGVPKMRERHTALWSGAAMLVWGGFDGGVHLGNGGAFDPASGSGSWSAITDSGAPSGRSRHVAVWTGLQMMVWGGCGGDSCFETRDDGGFWTPGADGGQWVAVPSGKVASGRIDATLVWTGNEAIVWGGKAGLTGQLLNTGAQSVPDM